MKNYISIITKLNQNTDNDVTVSSTINRSYTGSDIMNYK